MNKDFVYVLNCSRFDIGVKMKLARVLDGGLSQTQLAEKLGIDRRTISRIEDGNSLWKIEVKLIVEEWLESVFDEHCRQVKIKKRGD